MEWPASLSTYRPLGRNKFFRGGPNILVPGGTNLRGVQIKRDSYACTGNGALSTRCSARTIKYLKYNSDGPKVSYYSSVIIVKNRDTTPRPV